MKKNIAKILTIAGSDPSGGGGIQADIKTITANKAYAAAAITCLTAQNTKKVTEIFYTPVNFLRAQLTEILNDIKFDVIKIGMVGNSEIIECIANLLEEKAPNIPIILDTIITSTGGNALLQKSAIATLKKRLIKNAFLVTPNIDEAEILANMPINNIADMKIAALKIKKLGTKNVLIKGGHLKNNSDSITHILLTDNLAQNQNKAKINSNFFVIKNKKISAKKIRGTGCTLSSAIATNFAKENNLLKAVKIANNYVYRCIKSNHQIGHGANVLKHW